MKATLLAEHDRAIRLVIAALAIVSRPLEKTLFAAVHESAFGTKQTSQSTELMSAFGGKADIVQTSENVRL